MDFDLLDPVLDVLEGLPFINGVSEYNPHGSPVVGLSDGLELLLTSSVPNLQSDLIIPNEDCLDFEVDSNGGEVGGHEVIIAKLEQHVGLAYPAVANH